MPVGAVLGAAGIGAAGSVASSRAQSSAARNAAQTAQNATDANNATALQIFNQQTALNEPFRQYEIQQRNALGEVLGFDPVGQSAGAGMPAGGQVGGQVGAFPNAFGAYVNQNPDLQQEYQALGSRPGGYAFGPNLPQSYDVNGNGRVDQAEYGQFHYNQFGQSEGRQLPTMAGNQGGPATAGIPGKPMTQVQDTQGVTDSVATTTGATQGLFGSSIGGADRFNNSLFNPLAQTMFNTDRDRIDANLANSGLLYDGVRQTAVQEAGNRSAQNALSMYLNTIMGSPSTQATNNLTTAAGNYGSNVMNNTTSGANALMAAQQAQGQSQADMWGNLATAGGSALGAFNWGGKSKFGF